MRTTMHSMASISRRQAVTSPALEQTLVPPSYRYPATLITVSTYTEIVGLPISPTTIYTCYPSQVSSGHESLDLENLRPMATHATL